MGTWMNLICSALVASQVSASPVECLLEPRHVVDIKAPLDGLIERIAVDRGDSVKEGQIVVELDTRVDVARLNLARFKASMRGGVQAAHSRVDFSAKKLDRQQRLYSQNYAAAHDRDEAEAGKALAEAELVEAEDNIQSSHIQVQEHEEIIRLKRLRSPFDGIVTQRFHHPGEVARSDDSKPIMTLTEIDPLYVEVVLPTSALGRIKPGDNVTVTPDPPINGQYTARVKVVDPVVDAASGTFGVRLELPNPKHMIPPGVRCRADFPML